MPKAGIQKYQFTDHQPKNKYRTSSTTKVTTIMEVRCYQFPATGMMAKQ